MSDENKNHDPSLDDIYSKIRKDKDIEKKEKTTVPFKFLDSYTLEDKDIFFGRDNEIEEIYRKFYKDKILLVYGKSGTGKSSVVNCGLMSRIPKQDIYTINVRCGKAAYQNFITELKKHSQEDTDDSAKLIEDIFFKCFKPVAIIFDQFEEAFILSDKKERQKLVQELKKLLESELNINLVFIIREEYYANLTEFEEKIPEIESNRIRIEKMSKATVKDAIEKPCEVCNVGIEEGLPEKIIEQLIWQSGGLELTWLQILMDKLYKIATDRDPVNPVIKHEDLTKLGRMGNVLSDFLDEQLQLMPNGEHGEAVLKTMISIDGTKKQVNLDDISQTLQTTGFVLDKRAIEEILRHFVNVRIITDKDEQGYYELRHDGIAARIYERMTAIEKELIEVKTFIENSYKNYEKRKVLLTDNDLKYIALYESKLFLNKELNDFLQTSKKEVQKVKRRKRNIVVASTLALFIILSGFTIWALNERTKAILEKQKSQANNFNFVAKEVVDQDPTTALRLAEYALSLDSTNEIIKDNLIRIYYDNNFYKIVGSHENSFSSVAFSPDGKTILIGSADKTARLWDLEGNQLQVFKGHEDFIRSVTFSPDGKIILTGSFDETARLWDLQGNELQVFKGHEHRIISVAFSPDGKTILTGSFDRTARLWDLDGNELQVFKRHESWISSIAFSPDGKTILTGSDDRTARLWDLDGNELQVFKGHESSIISVAFSPDGKTILTGSWDNTVRIWDIEGNQIQVFKGHEDRINSVAFSPDGKTILTGSGDNTARIWDLEGNQIQVFKGHEDRINSVAFSPDGKTILTSSPDNIASLWDLNGNFISFLKEYDHYPFLIAFSPNGRTIATSSRKYIPFEEYSLITTTSDKFICIWDYKGNLLHTFKGYTEIIWSITFSPDGKTILIGSADNTARIWDLEGNQIQVFKGHESSIISVAFSPNGKTILTGSDDRTARLWDLDGNELQVFKGHEDRVLSIAFSPDGKIILTGSRDNTARLWDMEGNLLQIFKGPEYSIFSVAYSPDGKTILTGGERTARLYDVKPSLKEFQKNDEYEKLHLINKIKYGILVYKDVYKLKDEDKLYEAADYYYGTSGILEKDKKIEYLNNALNLYNKLLSKQKKAKYFTGLLDVYLALYNIEPRNEKSIKRINEIVDEFLSINDYNELLESADYFYSYFTQNKEISLKLKFHDKALQLYSKILTINNVDEQTKSNIAQNCGGFSYLLILEKEFENALQAALIAKEANPSYLLTYTNLALSYLFNDQFEEAKEVYLEWKDKAFTIDMRYETFKDVFLADLEDLEKAGITHPDFEKIRSLLEQ